jgi:hypothetical protein
LVGWFSRLGGWRRIAAARQYKTARAAAVQPMPDRRPVPCSTATRPPGRHQPPTAGRKSQPLESSSHPRAPVCRLWSCLPAEGALPAVQRECWAALCAGSRAAAQATAPRCSCCSARAAHAAARATPTAALPGMLQRCLGGYSVVTMRPLTMPIAAWTSLMLSPGALRLGGPRVHLQTETIAAPACSNIKRKRN